VLRFLKKHCFKNVNAPKFTWFGFGPCILPLQAVKDHDWDMTRLLLHFGADPEQKDSQGHTALDYVKSKVLWEHFSFRFTGGKSTRAPFEVYPICEAQSPPESSGSPAASPGLGALSRFCDKLGLFTPLLVIIFELTLIVGSAGLRGPPFHRSVGLKAIE